MVWARNDVGPEWHRPPVLPDPSGPDNRAACIADDNLRDQKPSESVANTMRGAIG
jgi:hypothetical protein